MPVAGVEETVTRVVPVDILLVPYLLLLGKVSQSLLGKGELFIPVTR